MYLKCDVLLLTDMFEKFRNSSLKSYELCPSPYLSATGLSWHAKLKMAKIELQLIPDSAMYIFFKEGTKGGISYIFNICSNVNNNYFKSYDPKHIIYLDVNDLYRYEMSKFLPASEFKWIDRKEFGLNKYTSNS